MISDLLQTPAFDATSKRFCDICNIDVKIGLGGESNWTTHLNSGPHIRAQGALQKNKVSNYFLKPTEQPDAGPSSSVIEPARLSSTILVPPSDVVQTEIANTADIIMIDDEHDSGRQAPDLPRSLIDRLRGIFAAYLLNLTATPIISPTLVALTKVKAAKTWSLRMDLTVTNIMTRRWNRVPLRFILIRQTQIEWNPVQQLIYCPHHI